MRTDDPAPEDCDSRRAALISTIEGEMVPRLLMLGRSVGAQHNSDSSPGKTTEPWDVEELARLLVAHGPEIAWAFVEAAHRRGVSYDRICVGLLAPAARRLAEQWERRDFGKSELTLGLTGLRTVLLEIGNAAKTSATFPATADPAVFTLPGEKFLDSLQRFVRPLLVGHVAKIGK